MKLKMQARDTATELGRERGKERTHPDAVLELDAADLDRLEERGKGLSIGLRIKRGTRGRILARDVVRNVRCGRVDERGHGRQ